MARPAKPISMTRGHRTKAEKEMRQKAEDRLRGADIDMTPPEDLTETQKQYFQFVVDGYKESKILSSLDVPLVVEYARCLDRLNAVEKKIDENPELVTDKDISMIQNKYFKQFDVMTKMLCMNPLSRAGSGVDLVKEEKAQTIADILNNGEE